MTRPDFTQPPPGYGPPPGYPPPADGPQPPEPPVRRRRRWPLALGGLVVLVVIIAAASHGGGSPSTPAGAALAGKATGSSAPAPAGTVAPAPAVQASAAPTTTAAPIPPPVTYTGSGDDVVSITKPAGVVIATIAGNKGRHDNFIVQGIDGDQDLLVNVTDPYSGSTLLDANGGNTTQLKVTAHGPWTITLTDIRSAPDLNPGANTGTGDTVLKYLGAAGKATIAGNAAKDNFIVQQYTGSGQELLVNETDPYQGTVPLAAGPALVTVKATGPWSIGVQ